MDTTTVKVIKLAQPITLDRWDYNLFFGPVIIQTPPKPIVVSDR